MNLSDIDLHQLVQDDHGMDVDDIVFDPADVRGMDSTRAAKVLFEKYKSEGLGKADGSERNKALWARIGVFLTTGAAEVDRAQKRARELRSNPYAYLLTDGGKDRG